MKLYVVGAKTDDPQDWCPAAGYALVLAMDEDAARLKAGREDRCPVAEIPSDEERLLVSVSDVY